MGNNHKHMVHQEVRILDEVIEVLMKPTKYGISSDDLFKYLNSYNINDESTGSHKQQISTKMIDFKKFLDLGRLLASKNAAPFAALQENLSTNVYINHLTNTPDFATKTIDASSTCTYYMPDLRLPIKNVLILFINYFKKHETDLSEKESVDGVAHQETSTYKESCDNMRSLMLLLNVSIINKLVNIFKTLNPEMKLKNESLMVNL